MKQANGWFLKLLFIFIMMNALSGCATPSHSSVNNNGVSSPALSAPNRPTGRIVSPANFQRTSVQDSAMMNVPIY